MFLLPPNDIINNSMPAKKNNNISDAEMSETIEGLREKMLSDAIRNGASDIHIEPGYDSMMIRFRIAGDLHPWDRRQLSDQEPLISHLKVISGLDILKHTLPQEGHFAWSSEQISGTADGRILDIRTSFFPTAYGETVVLRILNRGDLPESLDALGFSTADDIALTRKIIHQSHGMVLAAGPAGSGKTFTLYAILNELRNENKNIVTLEDPIEYYLPTVRQSQMRPDQGFTYAMGLRSILRQDPDIIMVGEIRDLETAESAIRASLTGRLLLSTIHANSSVATVTRLIDMNIDKGLVAYALSGVISKRLVRKNCEACRIPYHPRKEVLDALGLDQKEAYMRGNGCETCGNTGIAGRIGIFEILHIDDDMQRLIIENAPHAKLFEYARAQGLKTIREDGIVKIHAGITTPEEVLKAVS
ncbi:MAG: Type 4 fimbrial assembly protein PilB [Parcubacteria group bacterium GW2011_GWA2_45_30]|nr:MAG: Type 4 fimbrial assembly protein PilB [Parcubacteria group bacterium GW2011_GWA2_45_30]